MAHQISDILVSTTHGEPEGSPGSVRHTVHDIEVENDCPVISCLVLSPDIFSQRCRISLDRLQDGHCTSSSTSVGPIGHSANIFMRLLVSLRLYLA